MKKFRFFPLLLLICLLAGVFAPGAAALDAPAVQCGYYVLLETNTDTVLAESNSAQRAYPASLTKMMTVLLAVEAIEDQRVVPSGVTATLNTAVTASANYNFDMVSDGSTASILAGETLTLEDLLYCAMLSSANEACNIIGEFIGGSVEGFVALMNQRAAELGCTGTHFANTHGLPNQEHYSTAWDLSLIAREAVNHALFREICGTKTRTLSPTNLSAARELYNTNSLINTNDHYAGDYLYEGAHGIKTGFTADAGYCLASYATREGVNNIQILSIVLLAPAYDNNSDGALDQYCNFTDAALLFNWGFDNWSYREILKSTDIITEVPVSMGDGTDTVTVRPSSSITRLLPNDEDLGVYQRVPTIYATASGGKLEAPISAGEVLGEISILKDGKTVGTASLVASADVSLSRVRYMRSELKETLGRPVVRWAFWILLLLFAGYMLIVVRYRVRRRRYVARIRNARLAREIAEGEEDVREWYETGANHSKLRRTVRPAAKPGQTRQTPSAAVLEPTRQTPSAAVISEPTRQTTSAAAVSEPTRQTTPVPPRRPAARPAAPANPLDPNAANDQHFCDYFEEFFGEKK